MASGKGSRLAGTGFLFHTAKLATGNFIDFVVRGL